jgi:hypothetical protein
MKYIKKILKILKILLMNYSGTEKHGQEDTSKKILNIKIFYLKKDPIL